MFGFKTIEILFLNLKYDILMLYSSNYQVWMYTYGTTFYSYSSRILNHNA